MPNTPILLFSSILPISISDSPSFLMEGDNIEEFEEISVFIQKNKDLFLEHWYHGIDLVKFYDTVKELKQWNYFQNILKNDNKYYEGLWVNIFYDLLP